jgi:hypothetical protein
MAKQDVPEDKNEQENLKVEEETNSEEPRYFKSIEETLGKNIEGEKIAPELKQEAGAYISKEKDETVLEFMREFVNDNKDELKGKGLWIENGNDKYVLNIAKELDWKEALEADDKYGRYKEGLEHFDYLGRNFAKDNVPQQAKFLMVNKLNSAIEKREEQLVLAGKDLDTDSELKKFYSLAEKMSKEITGQDIRKDSERKNALPSKDDYISRNLESIKNELKEKTVADMGPYLEQFGYEVKLNKGFLKREFVVYGKDADGNLKKLKTFKGTGIIGPERVKDEKAYKNYLATALEADFKRGIEQLYSEEVSKNNKNITNKVRERIKEIASSPDKAEGGIELFFAEANAKDIKEEREKQERIKKKKEALAKEKGGVKNKKEDLKQRESYDEVTRNAMNLVDSLELSNNLDDDFDLIAETLAKEGYGVLDRKSLEENEYFQKNVASRYERSMKDKTKKGGQYEGFLMKFIMSILTNFTKK